MPFTESNHLSINRSACRVCGKEADDSSMIPLVLVRPAIVSEIRNDHPDLSVDGLICKYDLNRYRIRYVEGLLSSEQGELSKLDRDVLESLRQHELLTSNLNEEFVSKLTMGEALADRIATFGGSWKFIMLFSGVLLVWVMINTIFLAT